MNEKIENEEIVTFKVWSERSAEIDKLAVALSKAQAIIESAVKDSANPFFKSKYADLASVWAAIRKPLTDNGLSIIQEPFSNTGKAGVFTTLLHSSGQYTRSSLEVPVGKQDAQGFGSAITYVRRYSLQAIAGVCPEDDDGNAASDKEKPQPRPQATNTPKTSATPRPADLIPPKANSKVWDGEEIVTSGKYKPEGGKKTKWKDVPYEYLVYVIDAPKATPETKAKAEKEVIRRDTIGQPDFEAINRASVIQPEEVESINDEMYMDNLYK